jgi:hypothetical protein
VGPETTVQDPVQKTTNGLAGIVCGQCLDSILSLYFSTPKIVIFFKGGKKKKAFKITQT